MMKSRRQGGELGMKSIGIIHTTPATIDSITKLVQEIIPEAGIINVMDDSILKDMNAGYRVDKVRERWLAYAEILEQRGVSAILSACSTVGPFVEEADARLSIPVVRIDNAMCERAAEKSHVGVYATLKSTLSPTCDLIKRKAAQHGKEITIDAILLDGAYDSLMRGNREEHDRKIREAVTERIDKLDAVVLAQASMASAISGGIFQERQKQKILTSPRSGVTELANILKRED